MAYLRGAILVDAETVHSLQHFLVHGGAARNDEWMREFLLLDANDSQSLHPDSLRTAAMLTREACERLPRQGYFGRKTLGELASALAIYCASLELEKSGADEPQEHGADSR